MIPLHALNAGTGRAGGAGPPAAAAAAFAVLYAS